MYLDPLEFFGSLFGFFGPLNRRKNIRIYRKKNSRSFEEVRLDLFLRMCVCISVFLYTDSITIIAGFGF